MEEISFVSDFNYKEFLGDDFLTDCTLVVSSEEGEKEMKAHILVLANSSKYFHDMFTGEMSEAKTHIAHLTYNPMNLFPRVLQFLYTGEITWSLDEMMSLFSIARSYVIEPLHKALDTKISEVINENPDTLISLLGECYEKDFISELNYLVPYVTKYFKSFDIHVLSDSLDVVTFSKVLKPIIKDFSTEELVNILNDFIGDYTFENKEEEAEFLQLVPRNKVGVKNLLVSKGASWVPKNFLVTLK